MTTHKRRTTQKFHRNQVANLARRCGLNLTRYWDTNFQAWFYRIRARHRGRSFPYPGSTAGYQLDFCPTEQHTALERVAIYCSRKAERLA